MIRAGDELTIAYAGYNIDAVALEDQDAHGWVEVEQITDFEDYERRPHFKAAVEYCVSRGQKPPRSPFDVMGETLMAMKYHTHRLNR